jgi:ParB-like chromosome segregation protein Spo0J
LERTISVGDTSFRLQATQLPISKLIPNPEQPRQGRTLDAELRRSIAETKGLTTPLLVERINEDEAQRKIEHLRTRYQEDTQILHFLDNCKAEYMIIDGERRWANIVKLLFEDEKYSNVLGTVPVDLVDGSLTEIQRYVLWVSIHKLRKDWRAMEQEGAARQLIKYFNDDHKAASILGVTPTRLKKMIEIYDLAQQLKTSKGPKAISYARELLNLSSRLRTPDVMKVVIEKIQSNQIADPVDIRKLRRILVEPEARRKFLEEGMTIKDAMAYTTPNQLSSSTSLLRNLAAFRKLLNTYGWNDVQALKKDPEALTEIEQTLAVLNDLRKIVS